MSNLEDYAVKFGLLWFKMVTDLFTKYLVLKGHSIRPDISDLNCPKLINFSLNIFYRMILFLD